MVEEYIATEADTVMYGRRVGGDERAARGAITDLPIKGFAQQYQGRAGLDSKKMYTASEASLVLKLERTIVPMIPFPRTARFLRACVPYHVGAR